MAQLSTSPSCCPVASSRLLPRPPDVAPISIPESLSRGHVGVFLERVLEAPRMWLAEVAVVVCRQGTGMAQGRTFTGRDPARPRDHPAGRQRRAGVGVATAATQTAPTRRGRGRGRRGRQDVGAAADTMNTRQGVAVRAETATAATETEADLAAGAGATGEMHRSETGQRFMPRCILKTGLRVAFNKEDQTKQGRPDKEDGPVEIYFSSRTNGE